MALRSHSPSSHPSRTITSHPAKEQESSILKCMCWHLWIHTQEHAHTATGRTHECPTHTHSRAFHPSVVLDERSANLRLFVDVYFESVVGPIKLSAHTHTHGQNSKHKCNLGLLLSAHVDALISSVIRSLLRPLDFEVSQHILLIDAWVAGELIDTPPKHAHLDVPLLPLSSLSSMLNMRPTRPSRFM